MPYLYVPELPQDEDVNRPTVQLIGQDGNVFNLMCVCKTAMIKYQEHTDPDYNAEINFEEMYEEICHGDYDNALQVILGYMDVH